MCSGKKKKSLSIKRITMLSSDKGNLSTSCRFKQIVAQWHTCLQLQLFLHILRTVMQVTIAWKYGIV